MLTERSSAAGQGSQAPPRSRLAAWTSQAGRLPDADHTSPGAPAGHVRRRRARSRGALSAGHPLAGHGAALHTGAKLNAENVKRPAETVAGKKAEQPHTQGCAFQEGVSAEPRRIRARQADYRRRCRVLSSPVQWFFEPLHGFTPRWGQATSRRPTLRVQNGRGGRSHRLICFRAGVWEPQPPSPALNYGYRRKLCVVDLIPVDEDSLFVR
jgi:hypothetical protein